MFRTKKNLLLAMSLFLTVGLFGQVSIEKGYVGAGFGFTKLTGDIGKGGSGGLNYFVDGAIYLLPKTAVGLEGNFNLHGYKDANDDLKFRAAGLYLAKAEHYFMDNSFSPFVGLGLGFANIQRPEVTDGSGTVLLEEKNKFNFAISPRLGLVAGGFHMEFIYNLAGKEPSIEGLETFNYNFWSLSLGYRYTFDL